MDPFIVDDSTLAARLRASRFDHLVKALAIDLSLGGTYAEEVALRAHLSKEIPPSSLEEGQVAAIAKAIQSLLKDIRPCVTLQEGVPVDVTLFPLAAYVNAEHEFFPSFSAAQDSFWVRYVPPKKISAGRQKRETILAQQLLQKAAIDEIVDGAQRRAELIYLHYGVVKELLDSIRRVAKEDGWKAAKTRYTGHPLVRSVDEKKGTVVIDIGD